MAELTDARRAELEADLVLYRAKLKDIRLNGATTSFSHGNDAGSRSRSNTAVTVEGLREAIDETLALLGRPCEFAKPVAAFRPRIYQ